jgi:DNA-binding PadR family transcriptional regulator
MIESPSDHELQELLSNWESVFKRGLLTFWILLLLHDHSSFPYEMNQEIEEISNGSMSADANSIYRALRRLEDTGLVSSKLHPSSSGPDRRYYRITDRGSMLLKAFISRNIMTFHERSVYDQIRKVLKSSNQTPGESTNE